MDERNSPQVDPAAAALPSPPLPDSLLLAWIVRFRWIFFALIGVLLLAAYNGQWHIGRDSSLYRSVGHNLATGKGYTFRGQRERHSYPGLPLLFAGIEKVFGPQDTYRPRACMLVMLGIAAAILVCVHQLVRTYYPPWIAVCVTTGLGINIGFLKLAHELMTDLPFLLGVCMTLLGLARLGQRPGGWRRAGWSVLLLAGAGIALVMRPTFWALAMACAMACVVGMFRSRQRLWYALGIVCVVALAAIWWKVDPRLQNGPLSSGGYEKAVRAQVSIIGTGEWFRSLHLTLEKHTPLAMFGFELYFPAGTILFTALVAGAFILMRRSLLWGLYVLTTIAMMLVLHSVPRYFLMILPLLLVEWALIVKWLADRLGRTPRAHMGVLMCGLGVATIVHLGRCADFILMQHGISHRDFKRKTFLETYRHGEYKPLVEISKTINKRVRPGEKVLGLEPRIMSFLSGRDVFQPSELGRDRVATMLRKGQIKYCIWGPKMPGVKEIVDLIRRRILVFDRRDVVRKDRGVRFASLMKPSVVERRPATRPAKPPPATRPAKVRPAK